MKKRLLVTGGAGFIGSHFCAIAVTQGYRVVVLDALTYAGSPRNLEGIAIDDCVQGNIADGGLIHDVLRRFEIDAVAHFAAESHVDRSIVGPQAFIETNIVGTYQLLQESRRYLEERSDRRSSFRFLHVSTDEVFGSLGNQGKFTETTPYSPRSPYSASKAASDHLARAWFHTYGFPALVTNCTNNYGPRQYPEKLIPVMIQNALAGRPLPVYGEGLNVRDWIHVEDHCRGLLLALEKGQPGETYCFGGDSEKRNIDVVHWICDALDELAPRTGGRSYRELISYVKDRPGHDWRYAMDDQKAVRELGFRHEVGFEAGLRGTVQWYLENQAWVKHWSERG